MSLFISLQFHCTHEANIRNPFWWAQLTFPYWAERLRSDSTYPDSLLLLAGCQSSCFRAAGLEREGNATGFWCYGVPIMKWCQTAVDEMSRCCRIDTRVLPRPAKAAGVHKRCISFGSDTSKDCQRILCRGVAIECDETYARQTNWAS